AAVFLQKSAEFGRPHLRIIDGIGDHLVPIKADAESLGGIASGFRRDLHQANRIGRRLVTLVERTLGACYGINYATSNIGGDRIVLRDSDRRERVVGEREAAGKRRLSDLQHGTSIVAATGEFG